MTKLAYRLVAIALSAALSLLAAEAVLRIMNMGFGNSPMEPDPYLHHVHPRNYAFVQQHPSGELGGFAIEYDGDGRVVRSRAEPPQAPLPCRVALMGDSFTEAGQVPFAESFAGLLEASARGTCEVRNYGVRSYSPAIYLVQWTREVRRWQPTIVFVLIFGNDVREDVAYLSTSVRDADGWPTAIEGPADGWLVSQLRRSYVARFGRMVGLRALWAWEHTGEDQWTVGGVVEEHPEWSGPTPGLMEELGRRVAADGTQLVVMAVPSRYRLMGDGRIPITGPDFHDTVRTFATERGMNFLDLRTPFERASRAGFPLFFLQDIHFTADGHSVTAAAIARALRGGFPRPDRPAGHSAYGESQ